MYFATHFAAGDGQPTEITTVLTSVVTIYTRVGMINNKWLLKLTLYISRQSMKGNSGSALL